MSVKLKGAAATIVKRKKSVSSADKAPEAKKAKLSSGSSKSKAVAKKAKEESEDDEEEFPSSSEDELEQKGDDSDSSDNDNWGSDSSDEEDDDEEKEENGKSKKSKKASTDEDGESDKSGLLSSKESHAKQKKLKEERKMAKPNADTVQNVKQLWERLRVKKLTAEARKKLIADAWSQSKSIVKEIALKHDTSRVVQTMVKYSDKATRKAITDELKPIYYDLATASYGKYLIIKLLHYGTTETRDEICEALLSNGSARKLIRHVHGAYVLEDMYCLYASPKYKNYIILEFFDISSSQKWKKESERFDTVGALIEKHPEKRPEVLAQAFKRLQAAVEKGSIGFNVIHAVMLQYIKNINIATSERENFVDLVTEQIAEIVHTAEGSETASRVFAIATAKERKQLLKSMREFGYKLASDEHGCFVLITIFETIDDTVLVRKVFTDAFKDHMGAMLMSKSGRRALLYLLLGPSSRYFSKDQINTFKTINELKQTTSKKDQEARLKENLESFSPLMLDTIVDYPRKVFDESIGSQTAVEVLLYAAGDKTAALQAVADTFKGDINNSGESGKSIFDQPFVSRALRTLVQGGHWNNTKKEVDVVPKERNAEIGEFKTMLADAIEEDYIKDWATGDGAFVIVSLLEALDKKSSQHKKLVAGLKKNAKKIKASAENNKGSKLIVETLKL